MTASLVTSVALTIALPLIYQCLPNPIGVWWQVKHQALPMPPAVERRAHMVSRLIPVVQLLLLAIVTWMVLPHGGALVDLRSLNLRQWSVKSLLGTIAGAAWLVVALSSYRLRRPSRQQLARHRFLEEPTPYWVVLSLSAAVIEEAWRAVCLMLLSSLGSPSALAITTVAFALGHAPPVGAVVPAALASIYLGGLFLWTGSVVASTIAHGIINLGSIALVHYWYRTQVV